jgi:hypothetical protein
MSVEGSPGMKGGTRVPAAIPISPRRFNIACLTLGSTGVWTESCRSGSWFGSKPHDHITVPAPKTMAPLSCL